ncbi:MAG: exopolysaccharide biosynthesis protein [Verrucomicrobia bacterium]|nr:exopolysaccharide biosynthesis protein [Verrucomicrobiota bacterium]
MRKIEKFKTLEEGILLLQKKAQYMPISIEEIFHILPGKGQALVLIFLSFPFCLPIQIPGLSLPFGVAVAFFGLRMVFGKRIWLPKRILSKTIKAQTIQKITNKALSFIRKMKRWIHPRLSWICHLSNMRAINGFTIFLLGVFLALPLPIPFTNLSAAWSIFLIALGLLEDDGIIVILGYLVTLITIIFFVVMVLYIKHFF